MIKIFSIKRGRKRERKRQIDRQRERDRERDRDREAEKEKDKFHVQTDRKIYIEKKVRRGHQREKTLNYAYICK